MARLLAMILAVCLLLCACGAPEQPVSPEETAPPPATQPLPEPTEPEPTEPEPTQPAPHWLHSGIREDGSFAEGTLFLGDSLTAGLFSGYLEPNGLSDDAWVMATPGASPAAFFSGPEMMEDDGFYSYFSGRFREKRMYEGVASLGESAKAIYFMMGTNHPDVINQETYIKILEFLLEKCPNATIYLQMVPYSTAESVDHEMINWEIATAYNHFKLDLGEERIHLLQTQVAIGLNLKSDGVHLTPQGYECWHQALIDYARENQIPQ